MSLEDEDFCALFNSTASSVLKTTSGLEKEICKGFVLFCFVFE